MFGNWLVGVHPKLKALIHVVIHALVWAIWNCKNDCVFNKTKLPKKICRLSSELSDGSVSGAPCNVLRPERLWTLGATNERWSHGMRSIGLDDGSVMRNLNESCNLIIGRLYLVFFFVTLYIFSDDC